MHDLDKYKWHKIISSFCSNVCLECISSVQSPQIMCSGDMKLTHSPSPSLSVASFALVPIHSFNWVPVWMDQSHKFSTKNYVQRIIHTQTQTPRRPQNDAVQLLIYLCSKQLSIGRWSNAISMMTYSLSLSLSIAIALVRLDESNGSCRGGQLWRCGQRRRLFFNTGINMC